MKVKALIYIMNHEIISGSKKISLERI